MTDVRQFLAEMEAEQRLLTVEAPIDPYDYEAIAVVARLEEDHRRRDAVLFEAPRPLGQRSSSIGARMLFNVYGEVDHIAIAMGRAGIDRNELLAAVTERQRQDIPPQEVSTAPVQEVVRRGDEVDLQVLPFARHVEMEGGPYFTPTVVARDPRSDRYNLSWNRCMYLDPSHVALHVSPRQLWGYIMEAESRSEPLKVAIVLGHHPLFNQAAASLVPLDRDEYAAAGGLMNEPVRVTSSVSFGSDLLVPADAEIILEGEILPGQRCLEGPFGEYMGYLGPQKLSNVVKVTAMTHRAQPIITEIAACRADHINACIAIEASLLDAARRAVPSVVAASWLDVGASTTLVLSLRKQSEGLVMRAAMAVLSASNLIKQVIVVDPDVDVRDAHDVLWAVSTRVRADEDIATIKGIQGALLDPTLGGTIGTTALVIDATMPLDRPYPARASVPRDVMERVDLSALVPSLDGRAADVRRG